MNKAAKYITVIMDILLAIVCYFLGYSDGVKKEQKRFQIIQSMDQKIASSMDK